MGTGVRCANDVGTGDVGGGGGGSNGTAPVGTNDTASPPAAFGSGGADLEISNKCGC